MVPTTSMVALPASAALVSLPVYSLFADYLPGLATAGFASSTGSDQLPLAHLPGPAPTGFYWLVSGLAPAGSTNLLGPALLALLTCSDWLLPASLRMPTMPHATSAASVSFAALCESLVPT